MNNNNNNNTTNSSIKSIPPIHNDTIVLDDDNIDNSSSYYDHALLGHGDDLIHFFLCWKRQSCDACLSSNGRGKDEDDVLCSWCPFVG